MRRFLFSLTLLLACAGAWAQGHHFRVEDRQVSWQQVFPSELDSAAIVRAVSLSGAFADVVPVEGGVTFRVLPHEADYEVAGFKRGRTPMVLLACLVECHALVEFRDGRYRVTADNFTVIEDMDSHFFQRGRRSSLESWVLDGERFKKDFVSSGLAPILESDLLCLFSFKEKQEEDW